MTCLLALQSSAQSTQEKKGQVWKRTHGEGKPWRSTAQETEDADSDDQREQSIGRDCAGLGRIIKGSQTQKDGGWTLSESVSGWCETAGNYSCRFLVVEICPSSKVKRVGYRKQAVAQKLVRQGECMTELQTTLGKEGIRLIRMRQGVSSGSDEQVGSSVQSTVTRTNEDKDDMEDVVDGEENVEHEEGVRDDDDKEEEEDVLDENEEKDGEEDDDEDGEKVTEEVVEEGE